MGRWQHNAGGCSVHSQGTVPSPVRTNAAEANNLQAAYLASCTSLCPQQPEKPSSSAPCPALVSFPGLFLPCAHQVQPLSYTPDPTKGPVRVAQAQPGHVQDMDTALAFSRGFSARTGLVMISAGPERVLRGPFSEFCDSL